jgi:predicted phosphodiesterase
VKRIALFSDVHGNLPALDAVLQDIERTGLNEVYCLGDLVGYGPDPAGVVDRVRRLGIPTIRGNYDDGVGKRLGQCGCYYATDQAKSDGEASYAFTDSALDDADHEWLAALPDSIRFRDGDTRVLLAHGSPRKINEYLLPDRSDQQLARLAAEAEADVVCIGHIHIPYQRLVATGSGTDERTVRYISDGSVGKPKDGDWRACWTELALDGAGGAQATFHRVEYDIDTVSQAMRDAGLPETLVSALRKA